MPNEAQRPPSSLRRLLDLREEPLFLMDGSAYIFRGYYANQSMTRSDGMPTNALYMVLRLIFKIFREESPAYFAFVLDGRGRNFRHRLYPEYKANRQVTPEPLSAQIGPLCALIRSLGLPLVISEDCEADDCIASLARRFSDARPVCILGADKDLRQCLSSKVSIWDPAGKEDRLLTLEDFVREQGFGPERWPDYQALVGDSSDNIPGISGIGPKAASSLLREFTGLEDIFGRLEAVPPALRKKLEGQKDLAFLSRKLTTLQENRCPEIRLEDLRLTAPIEQELLPLLRTYELRSLEREFLSIRRLDRLALEKDGTSGSGTAPRLGQAFHGGPNSPAAYVASAAPPAPSDPTVPPPIPAAPPETPVPPNLEKRYAPDAWTPDLSQARQGILFEQAAFIPDARPEPAQWRKKTDLPPDAPLALLPWREAGGSGQDKRLLLGDGQREFICSDAEGTLAPGLLEDLASRPALVAPEFKRLCETCPELRRLPVAGIFDPSLAAWLINPEEYDYAFSRLILRWGEGESRPGTLPSALALDLKKNLEVQLKANELDKLLLNMEMPLIPVLLDMQRRGLGIDLAAFKTFLDESQAELDRLTNGIYTSAGREFNIRSARQLGEVLYSLLDLPKARKTAGGQISTAVDALEKLQGRHPIIRLILDYRKLEKLRSTYLEPLPRLADAQGRLHTSFNQNSTATGRLSSSSPNLQNIPVRGSQGGRMRACFTAAPGQLLVSADYSQIELRVLAHLSQDPTLLEAFRRGEDIHSRTAALLFDLPP
ncbi:MAG: DNA polymerase, partial [Desulfovibrionaceae bacterium]|nr:DNA polymerase [Desulfovibrionaceae bacterium]